MHLAHLSLSNFRNYTRLELPLTTGVTVITGDNAQGKSNLLEAILYLATTKSFRSSSDRELINWLASSEEVSFARVEARLERRTGPLRIEIVLQEEQQLDAVGWAAPQNSATSKRIRVNGLARRALDLIGNANVVLFSPQDLAIVAGAPLWRRRYLDLSISQVDPRYVRALARYNKVLVQRNHLLRQVRERHGNTEQLLFWDQELTTAGAYVLVRRLETVAALNRLVRDVHQNLTEHRELLSIAYRGTIDEAGHESVEMTGDGAAEEIEGELARVSEAFQRLLRRHQGREIAYGATMFGPHRDDLGLKIEEREVGVYGSRGQQRTAALSLKLAEAALMTERTGEEPIVLLDDIMSELDHHRSARVIRALDGLHQVLITTIDLRAFADIIPTAKVLRVEQGVIETVGTVNHHVVVAD